LGRLQADIKWELGDRFFFYAPIERKKVFDEIQFSWKDICKAFPTAWADIQEASFCYTLERDTACLFHLMRIAEHGVRRLARTLKVTLTHKGRVHPIEYADWEKIITGIKVRIDAMRQLPHGKKRKEALQRYSDLADHCSYMKDIWRNDISHAGKPYIGPEALLAIRRVYGFMSLLTKKQ
jgi:hypothetical protein